MAECMRFFSHIYSKDDKVGRSDSSSKI